MGKHSKKTSSKNKTKKTKKKGEKARAEAGAALQAWARGDGGDESEDNEIASGSDDESVDGSVNTSQSLDVKGHQGSEDLDGLEQGTDRGKESTPAGALRSTVIAVSVLGEHRTEPSSLCDLHTHSTCSDGLLSPTELLRRAARNGVKILALTDHDTMAGVDEAMEVGMEMGVRVIPGVELSATLEKIKNDDLPGKPGKNSKEVGRWDVGPGGDGVHILGYFATWSLGAMGELEGEMEKIREGRFRRAEEIVRKLRQLGKQIDYARVLEIAGKGVAPARPHIAQALVEAGYAESSRDAFSKYIGDYGPAYAKGAEVYAEEGVLLIRRHGGVAVLAHPWSLKDPVAVVKRLKKVGLQGMEVYRNNNSSLNPWSDLADQHGLMRLGGSDFHGTGARHEVDVGGVHVPATILKGFLNVAQGAWKSRLRERLESLASDSKADTDTHSVQEEYSQEERSLRREIRFSGWLTTEDRTTVRELARQLGLVVKAHRNGSRRCLVVRRSAKLD